MLRVFVESLLPVFIAAGGGVALSARLNLLPRPIAQVAFHLLAPCLVFRLLVDSRVPGATMARMAAFTVISLLAAAALGMLVARALQWPRRLAAAAVLAVLLPNAGNYGLAANRFAFGEEGLAHSSVFFVASAVVTFTLGVLVASLGHRGLGKSLAALPRVPALWSVLAALVCVRANWALPLPLDRVVSMFADACIPTMLVVLGMQLHRGGLRGPYRPVLATTALRLLGGLTLGLLLAPLFGLEGAAWQAGVLQSSMPTAVMTTILASEYELEPAFVSSVVFLSTLLSPITLAPLLVYLGA